MARREYQSGQPTTLLNPLGIGVLTFTLDLAEEFLVGWPDGAEGYPFWVTVDGGTPQEERILCESRSDAVVTVVTDGRGADGTSERNHLAGAVIWPSWSATDADESNAHINAITDVHGYTATAAEINILDGATLSTAELNILDGVTATTTELNYVDGVTSSIQTQLNGKSPIANPTFTGTVSGITKAMVGLGNVDNTSDTQKPISVATQNALNGKSGTAHGHDYLPLAGGTMTGQLNLADNVVLNLGTNGWIDLDDGGYIQFSNDDILSYNDTTGYYSFGADGDADGGAIIANEFATNDSAGSESDPAFTSPQGTSGMYFVGGSTITGIRFTVNGTHRYSITSSGGANASSIRGKDNVETYTVPTEDLLNIRTISYHPKGDERDVTAFGVIAEELNEVPSLRIFLDYEEDGSPVSVQYDRIALALINVVKEQQTRIDSLEQRLTALEAK
jgi:hypothetical protein